MSSKPRDLFPGALEMMVLRLVQHEPLHGYALVQRIRQVSRDLLQVEEGSLYPALQRLLKARLVQAEWGVSELGRRAKVYSLTREGRVQLDAEVAAWRKFAAGVAKVFAT